MARRLDRLPEARAVGEIGLDYHYDFSPRDVQQAVFRAQMQLARERDLPVVIHTREAEDDTLRILGEERAGRLRGVFHCFTGDPAAADARAGDRVLPVDSRASSTFPKAEALREAVAAGARRSPAGRDRQPVPGADSVSRQAQRAGLRREGGRTSVAGVPAAIASCASCDAARSGELRRACSGRRWPQSLALQRINAPRSR